MFNERATLLDEEPAQELGSGIPSNSESPRSSRHSKPARSRDRVESLSGDVFLERIPQPVYERLTEALTHRYGLVNGTSKGGKMRFAEYFLGLRRSTSNALFQFVVSLLEMGRAKRFPALELPHGLQASAENLSRFERDGGIALACFDLAVTKAGLRIIEAQSVSTYALSAAFASRFLQESLPIPGSSIFADHPQGGLSDLHHLMRTVIADDEVEGIVVADRDLLAQKTNFEHYATQCELSLDIDVIDTSWIFEQGDGLWYRRHGNDSSPQRLRRLYNRTLALEAIEEDAYPQPSSRWKFRFDRPYRDLIHTNHPGQNFAIAKHILPYVSHPFNPPCWELAQLTEALQRGELSYDQLVWKHKLGVAGRGLFLQPNRDTLHQLESSDCLDEHIAQQKIDFESFKTGDGLEKIVELRFMSVQSEDRLMVVPMARIGHSRTRADGRRSYHIHFGENNRPGYGFCPVLIVDD